MLADEGFEQNGYLNDKKRSHSGLRSFDRTGKAAAQKY